MTISSIYSSAEVVVHAQMPACHACRMPLTPVCKMCNISNWKSICRGMEGPSSFLDAPDPQPSGQLIMTEGVSNVILGLVPWLRTGAPLLLVGPEGCGKATLLQHCLAQLAVRHPPTQPCTSILSCCLLEEHAHLASALGSCYLDFLYLTGQF